MSESQVMSRHTRFVAAPAPTDSDIIPSIFGIELEETQEVEWHWLELPDGNKVVTDYRIIYRDSSDIIPDNGVS